VDISAYTGVFTDLTSAVSTAGTAIILPAVLAIAGGFVALRWAWGWLRYFIASVTDPGFSDTMNGGH
jgi:uncharacterized membrane protein YjgN (DUF898 family)